MNANLPHLRVSYLLSVSAFGFTLTLKERIEIIGGVQCWSVALTVNEYETSDASPTFVCQQNSYSFSRLVESTTSKLQLAVAFSAYLH